MLSTNLTGPFAFSSYWSKSKLTEPKLRNSSLENYRDTWMLPMIGTCSSGILFLVYAPYCPNPSWRTSESTTSRCTCHSLAELVAQGPGPQPVSGSNWVHVPTLKGRDPDPYSWANNANTILFIHPLNVGVSYGDGNAAVNSNPIAGNAPSTFSSSCS
jgi:hypothetical protein